MAETKYTPNKIKDLEILEDSAGAYVIAEKDGLAKRIPTDRLGSKDAILSSAQELTDAQKSQARANIGAVTTEDVFDDLIGTNEDDLLADMAWTVGFFYDSGGFEPSEQQAKFYGYLATTVNFISVTSGEPYRYVLKVPADVSDRWGTVDAEKKILEITFVEYDASGKFIQRVLTKPSDTVIDGKYEVARGEYIPSANTASIKTTTRTFRSDYNGSAVLELYEGDEPATDMRILPLSAGADAGRMVVTNGRKYVLADVPDVSKNVYLNPHIKAVAHRGYSAEAPENTLAAFRLAKKMGFDYVECDVQFTSDGVPVLLHDETVDRTSNGTGNIAEMTLEEVKALDFGTWFSNLYWGEPIPTFEEFIALCKRIGLKPYIELKGNTTVGQIGTLAAIVKRYGMLKECTWVSFYQTALTNLATAEPNAARIGVVTETPTDETIALANSLKTDVNEVFASVGHYALTEDFRDLCIENSIPIEAWTVDDAEILVQIDPYVSGYTSNSLRANVVLYDEFGG